MSQSIPRQLDLGNRPEAQSAQATSTVSGTVSPCILPGNGFEASVPQNGALMGAELGSIPCCPVCGGRLIEIRAKYQCSRCHRICETCCEGGRG